MTELYAYGGLFLTAFAAATIFPMQSEAVLIGLLLSERYSIWLLIAAASAGNILGAVVNWWLGRAMEHYRGRRWFPVSAAGLARAQAWYGRYGRWSLLASWVPFIGDPLTVVAGVLREPLWSFLLLVSLAKIGRYVVLAGLVTF